MIGFLGELLRLLLLLIELAGEALSFSPDAFVRAAVSREARDAALAIAFLAGVSEMLGQSVILVVNRIALYRFIASLAFTGVTYVLTAIAWGLSAVIIAPLTPLGALGQDQLGAMLGVIALAFAPRLFGVLSIAPYFGVALGNLLEVWAMVLAIFGLHAGLAMPMEAALVCGGAGWALSYGLRAFLGHALAKPLARIRVLVTGSALERTPRQILDDLAKTISGESKT